MSADDRSYHPEEKAPGTLTPEEVKDELRQMKNKLFNMPSTLAGAARAAMGKAPPPGQPAAQQPPAPQPVAPGAPPQASAAELGHAQTLAQEAPSSQEVLDRLAGLDHRLAQLERMVVEIHAHLVKG